MQESLQKIGVDEWADLLQVFDELVQVPPLEQDALIEKSQFSEVARNVLKSMLVSDENSSILDQPVDDLAQKLIDGEGHASQEVPSDLIGHQFGAWRIESQLAHGGMGQVFLAHRSDGQYEKKVALKLIKSGQHTAHTLKKFQEEMQTLARLEHPNIARMIDGGVNEDGISYIALELVEGQTITQYANGMKLLLHDRLSLVVQVCEALEFAHQNLVVHGDIKPDNVLVNQSGQVKLVDFGISHSLLDQNKSNDLARFTPGFSSPEQEKGKTLTTGSDVYSLSALLLVLCGLNFTQPASQLSRSDWLIKITADLEKLEPFGLNKKEFQNVFKKELGSVVFKGLSEKAKDRYKSITGLKDDLLSIINGEAVKTHSVSWVYSLKKSITKYKISYAVASLAFFGMLGFAVFAFNQAALAKKEAEKATWTSGFLKGIFEHADPVKNQQNPITVNELTQLAADRLLLDDLQYAPEVKLSSLFLLGNIQFKLGQAESAAQIHQKYIDLLHKHADDDDRLANGYFELGMDFTQLGNFELALKQFKAASKVMPMDEKLTHIGISSMVSVVLTELRLNNLDGAEQAFTELKAIEDKIMVVDQPYLTMQNYLTAESRYQQRMENYPAALVAVNKALLLMDKSQAYKIMEAEFLILKADIHEKLKQYDDSINAGSKALEIFKTHYGDDHPETLIALSNHASNLGNAGNHIESIEMYRRILNVIKDLNVPDYYQPVMLNNMAHQYRKNGQFTQAIENFKQALVLWQAMSQPNLMGVAMTNVGIAKSYLKLENIEESAEHFDETLTIIEQLHGKDSGLYAKYMLMKIPVLMQQNEHEDLKHIFPQTEGALLGKYGKDSDLIAKLYLEWAHFHSKQGDSNAARQKAQVAHDTYLKQQAPEKFKDALNSASSYLN